jgi:hypothetical protein
VNALTIPPILGGIPRPSSRGLRPSFHNIMSHP